MAAPGNNTVPKIDLLYPELLSKEGLLEILSQRFVKLPDDTANTTKEDLLELFYKHVIPRPQREYRFNRRGRDMARKQILHTKKRIAGPDNSEPPTKKFAQESPHLITSFGSPKPVDRLKPPPSCINFEKKVIKLGSSKPINNVESTSAVRVAGVPTGSDSAAAPSTPKVIKLNRTSSASNNSKSVSTAHANMTMNKTIKLINSHLDTSGDSVNMSESDGTKEEPMETDVSNTGSAKKIKINKISWP